MTKECKLSNSCKTFIGCMSCMVEFTRITLIKVFYWPMTPSAYTMIKKP